MLKYRKYFIFIGIYILFSLLISLIYLYGNISYNTISSITLVSNFILFAILGFLITKNSKTKGIISGLRIGSISIIILLILSLLFKCDFSVKTILYYLLVLLSIIFGSILSKNIKK